MRGPKPHRLLQAIPENCFQSAPRTGIEPVFSWFRARCNDQQLPPRCKTIFSTPSGNRTRSASFKGSRRDYAPERVPCGNRTRLASLEGWCLCRSAKGTCCEAEREGVEPSRPIQKARPGSSGVPSPVGLPFRKAAEAGIEPASRRLTVSFPYQHRTHRISQDGWI